MRCYLLKHCFKEGINEVETTAEAEQKWVDQIIRKYRDKAAFNATCTPGYLNNEGQASRLAAQNDAYGSGPIPFFKILSAWQEAGKMEGLELR